MLSDAVNVVACPGTETSTEGAAGDIVACLVPQLLEGSLPEGVAAAFCCWWGNLPGRQARELLPSLLAHLGVPAQVRPLPSAALLSAVARSCKTFWLQF